MGYEAYKNVSKFEYSADLTGAQRSKTLEKSQERCSSASDIAILNNSHSSIWMYKMKSSGGFEVYSECVKMTTFRQ